MDGNGRWARTHRFARVLGHRRGMETVRSVVTACRELGVEVLTLYAFSEENWNRPATEVRALMAILKSFLVSERKLMTEKEIRLKTIGNVSRLPGPVRKTLEETLALTRDFRRMTLVLALSYGGRDEITRAVRKIAEKARAGDLAPESIGPETLSRHLDTADLPDPDLIIRTSGEFRTSNFLPWQSIYSEYYITPTLWPDFTREEFLRAIENYGRRERRFGRTGEQLAPSKGTQRWHAAR
jgi:undecaprenyl diphosphate synthase